MRDRIAERRCASGALLTEASGDTRGGFSRLYGKVQKRDGTLSFLADDVWPLDEVTRRAEVGKLKNAGMVLDSHDFGKARGISRKADPSHLYMR